LSTACTSASLSALRTVLRVGYLGAVRWRRLTTEGGQTQGEFALLVAGVAVACIVAVLFLGGAVNGLWDRSSKPVSPNTFTPPSDPPSAVTPSTAADCENGGWTNYPQFETEQECLDSVAEITPGG
jgi:Flp pilus assembly pilin Flp